MGTHTHGPAHPTHQQTNMPANRASKGPREASRNSRSKASGNNSSAGARAPNRRQMRRMQANGLSSRKPRRPEAEEAGGKGHGAAEQGGDALSAGADNGIQIAKQRMPDKDSWAAKMHSIADLAAIARLKREEAEAEDASEASASE